MQWMALHDEVSAEAWLPSLQSATAEVLMANDEANLSAALSNLSQAASDVPEVQPVTTDRLLSWDPQDPAVWLPRMDTGANLSDELAGVMGQLASMTQNRTPAQQGQILAVSGPLQGQLGPLVGLQSVDFRAAILSCIPNEDADDPWNSDGPVMVTLVVSKQSKWKQCTEVENGKTSGRRQGSTRHGATRGCCRTSNPLFGRGKWSMFRLFFESGGEMHGIVHPQSQRKGTDRDRLRIDVVTCVTHDSVHPNNDHHQRNP